MQTKGENEMSIPALLLFGFIIGVTLQVLTVTNGLFQWVIFSLLLFLFAVLPDALLPEDRKRMKSLEKLIAELEK
jgi:hypothetical protein